MKTYLTTDKHPELKEGIIIEYEDGNWSSLNGWVYIKKNDLQVSIEKGYIKEVEEKEFTKSDMLKFALDWYPHSIHSKAETVKVFFNIWLKERS